MSACRTTHSTSRQCHTSFPNNLRAWRPWRERMSGGGWHRRLLLAGSRYRSRLSRHRCSRWRSSAHCQSSTLPRGAGSSRGPTMSRSLRMGAHVQAVAVIFNVPRHSHVSPVPQGLDVHADGAVPRTLVASANLQQRWAGWLTYTCRQRCRYGPTNVPRECCKGGYNHNATHLRGQYMGI